MMLAGGKGFNPLPVLTDYWRVSIDVCSARRICSRASSDGWGLGLAAIIVVPFTADGRSGAPADRSSVHHAGPGPGLPDVWRK